MSLLEVEDVVKNYSGHLALDSVSVNVPENSVYGLLGPNGAGKTTLIRIINHITAPDSGKVLLRGKVLSADDIVHIGYLPEERGLYKKMKVGEQALYLAQLKGMSKKDALSALKYWFEKFEIQPWWNKKIEELSKGMAQKVQFVTTILHKPQLLIFDEPFSGFDPVNTDLIKNEILQLKKEGATIIFSTHDMGSVEELCDHISLINRSKIVLQGSVIDIRNAHARHTYKLITSAPLQQNSYTVVEEKILQDGYEYIIQKHPGMTNASLLQEVIAQSDVLHFEALLPSMHEIFVQTVQTKND